MNREFDFDDIGKRMPYKTPESFFEDNRRRILKHTCGEERRVKNRLHIIIPTVLAAAAHVSVIGADINDGRKTSAETCRKGAFE